MKFELKVLYDNCVEETLDISLKDFATTEDIEESRLHFIGILKDCCQNNTGYFRVGDCIINMSKVSKVNFKLVE